MSAKQTHANDGGKEIDKTPSEYRLEIAELNSELVKLRAQVFKLRDELHMMKNSRVLGRVIKIREAVGASRKKATQIPRASVHKIRVVGAPLVPEPTRKFVKRAYKRARASITRSSPAVIEFVQNTAWREDRPLVSVVIPGYNHGATIDETLQSLEGQTFKGFEIILVDDGSKNPETVKKLEEIEANKPHVTVIRQENQGVAAARNTGITKAKGKYVICLDSDDMLEPTFIEKGTLLLETQPDISLITTYKNMFGVINERYENLPYEPIELYRNNMVITAAEFKREAWKAAGGYKSGIGYEDWEFWINLAELGFWGKLIPETLFRYRTSIQSRYVEDKDAHWRTIRDIHNLHPRYKSNIHSLMAEKRSIKQVVTPETSLINLKKTSEYQQPDSDKPHVLVASPWMTFGGAETLIVNFCKELKKDYNLSFITGLQSEHEWEYKFKEISENIYHLANLFESEDLYLEFISNYITTRNVDVLHIIHTSFLTDMMHELKQRHPKLKIVTTVFNDRAEHFDNSVKDQAFIDAYSTDNSAVADHYKRELAKDKSVTIIPNGINSTDIFNPENLDREEQRTSLGINEKDMAIFFIGRLSEEKNPDVFLEAARKVVNDANQKDIKFFVIGDGPMRLEVEKLLSDIQHPNVQYLGYQSEIARYLSGADVFVLPSSVEGFPLSILEAMAMNVVVISSDVGAVSEVIETGSDGFVVTPGSAQEISEVILRLKNDPKLLEAVKQKSRQTVNQKYSNKVLGQNYSNLYKEVLK